MHKSGVELVVRCLTKASGLPVTRAVDGFRETKDRVVMVF